MIRNSKQNLSRSRAYTYAKTGDYATTKVAKVIARKSWRWTLLNLAWTAGPVTLGSLYIGRLMGYGTAPSKELMIYFVFFTGMVGLSAVLASILHDAFYTPRIHKEKQRLLDTIDNAFSLIVHSRDLNLSLLSPTERRVMGAYYTLENPGCSVQAAKTAVMDLTGRKSLVQSLERTLSYNELGMSSLANDEWEEIKEEVDEIRQELQKSHPLVFQQLFNWLQGQAPHPRAGRERTEGFIQRVLDADLEDDLDLMTLNDAHEMFILVYELLNGREVAVLNAGFAGDRYLARERKRLSYTWNRYRLAIRSRNSAVHLICDELRKMEALEALPEILSNDRKRIAYIAEAIRALSYSEKGTIYPFFKQLQETHQESVTQRQALLKSITLYTRALNTYGEKLEFSLKENDITHAGFYLEESSIDLSDEEKVLLSRFLDQKLHKDIKKYNVDETKRFAIDLAVELDQMIHISTAEVQSAIESSNAVSIGFLSPHFTPMTKVGWTTRAIHSMQKNKKKASHRLARHLVNLYLVPISDSFIELFELEFGADPEYLQSLKKPETQKAKRVADRVPELSPLPSWETLAIN